MPKKNVLIVDDEEDILDLIEYNLAREGFDTVRVKTGEDALKAIRQVRPDAVILDLMLPGVGGLDVCRIIKDDPETRHVPVLMLTAKGEEPDIISGLEIGASDYITKPFSPRILVARLRAVLRQASQPVPGERDILKIHTIEIHPGHREVRVDAKPVDLTFTEFSILHFLARRPGWVFTRYQIVEAVRGEDYPVTDRSVDVQIVGLRKKLGPAGKYIETVRGVGYRFKEPPVSA
jgi:two-component system alkaline phosphatase synthesis response regulator PhoP